MTQPTPDGRITGHAAGWYPDPAGGAGQRWWDGHAWTAHVRAEGVVAPRRAPRGVVAGAVAVIVVCAVAMTALAVLSPGAGDATAETLHRASDRPGYARMAASVDEAYSTYSSALEDGGIFDLVPDTDDGAEYAETFVRYVSGLEASIALDWASSDEEELDGMIDATAEGLEETERRFLAWEDLGIEVRTGGEVLDGASPDHPSETEEWAAEYDADADADGSYVPAAEEVAEAFELELTFDWDDAYVACPGSAGQDDVFTIAAYCPASPGLVYVNTGYDGYPDNLEEAGFVSDIEHEISHHLIDERCGTTTPSIAGERTEGVTSSYAILYLGADREVLDGGRRDAYATDDETDEIARRIHAGQCS